MIFEAIANSNTGKSWDEQTFSDEKGDYKVSDIDAYAKKNGKSEEISIQPWESSPLKHNLEPSEHEEEEDLPGSPAFVQRAEKTDLKYPILVVDYKDEDPRYWIADGVHRLWKAKKEGKEYVSAYIIPSSVLHDGTYLPGEEQK